MSKPYVIYTRVSRVGKRRNDLLVSHDDQIASSRVFAASNKLPVLDDLTYRDEDRSANDYNRANFVRALALVERGEAAGIIVATLDRFTREVFDGANMLRRIAEYGGKLFALDTGGEVDLDDDESLIYYIMRGTMATLEHRRKARGLAASVKRSVLGGRHLANLYGYVRPEGFQTVTIGDESVKVRFPIEPHPTERQAVERAYVLRAAGQSWQRIADVLNDEYPLPSGNWTWGRVRSMVKSETYKGVAHSGEHRKPNAHTAIVSPSLWALANKPMPGPARDAESEPWLCSGIVYCGSCGYRMRPTTSNGRRYYKCKPRKKSGTCPAPVNIPAEAIEARMIEVASEELVGRIYGAAASGANVANAEAEYAAQLELIAAMAPRYMAAHILPDDVREIVEAEWTSANAKLDKLRRAKDAATEDALGLADLPPDFDASRINELPAAQLRRLIAAMFPVVFTRRAAAWRESIAERIRPLDRSAAPTEILDRKRERPIRPYFLPEPVPNGTGI